DGGQHHRRGSCLPADQTVAAWHYSLVAIVMSDYRHDLGDLNGASMKSRMGLVTVLLCALSACSVPGRSGESSAPSPSSSPQSSQTSTNDDDNRDIDSGDDDAENIVGDWTAAKT